MEVCFFVAIQLNIKNMKKIIYVLILCISVFYGISAQSPTYIGSIDPHESTGLPYADVGKFIFQTSDYLILVNGYVDVLDDLNRVQQLIRVDLRDYSTVEIREERGPYGDLAFASGIIGEDGYLYFTGPSLDKNMGGITRLFLAKYDTSLDLIWIDYFPEMDNPDWDRYAYSLCYAHDDGIMLAYGIRAPTGGSKIRVLKTDTSGTIIFDKLLPDTLDFTFGAGSSIMPTDDGNYVVTGMGEKIGTKYTVLHKIDREGEPMWTKYERRSNFLEQYPSTINLSDGGFAVALNRDTLFYPEDGGWPATICWSIEGYDTEGDRIWDHKWMNHAIYPDIINFHLARNKDLLGCGNWNDLIIDRFKGWIFRLSPEGELKWSRHYNDSLNRAFRMPLFFRDITELDDGRLAITGWAIDSTNHPGAVEGRNSNVLLMIVDSLGCLVPGCEGEEQLISSSNEWRIIGSMPMLKLEANPNPASGVVAIRWPREDLQAIERAYNLSAYDISGRLVWTGKWDGLPRSIDVGSWPDGTVLLVCHLRGQPVASAKIIINNH